MSNIVDYLCIDVEKAQSAPNAAYTIRLMFALNDLLALNFLYEMINRDKEGHPEYRFMYGGLIGYLLRLQEAHIVEAIDAFVTRMPNAGTSRHKGLAVSKSVKSNNQLSKILKKLKTLKEEPEYQLLTQVRNNLTFHYNWQDEGASTEEAIIQCIDELKSQKQGSCHGWVLTTGNLSPLRFLLADEVLNTAWRRHLGNIPDSPNYKDCPTTQKIKTFVTELGSTFIKFANAWILAWIQENDLALPDKPEL